MKTHWDWKVQVYKRMGIDLKKPEPKQKKDQNIENLKDELAYYKSMATRLKNERNKQK